jgi:amino acid adenylation domain-containing protein
VSVVLDEALTAGLKELGRRQGTTLFMTLLAGWATVLGRLSGQPEVVVGTATANRGRAEIEGLIGFFVNTLALRIDLSERPTVAELLGRVKARALEAQQNQDIPFEQVVERVRPSRSLAYSPLFQAAFDWQNTPQGEPSLPGLQPGDVPGAERTTAKFDLSLALGESEGRIVGGVEYATALYERATVERYLGYLRRVLEQMAADAGQVVERIVLLPVAERRLVVEEWNATAAGYPRDACIHGLFEAQVERTPDAVALVFGEEALSYAELNRRANRLAHHLRGLGVGPEARVGMCVERSLEMVVGVLATLKAGGAYVPLDPGYPAERLRYLLADSAPGVMLTQTSIAAAEEGLFTGLDLEVLALDAPEWEEAAATNPERGELGPEHLAFVIYTSGSTGTPKGVMAAHGGVCNLVSAGFPGFGLEPGDRVLQFASFSFDSCAFEIFRTLCRGATLHLVAPGEVLTGETLSRTAARYGITHVVLPPAVLDAMPGSEALDSVRTMVVAGDATREPLVRRWAPGRLLVNAYGPSETTVCASLHRCRSDEVGDPSIGSPLANTRIYILDGEGEPVPTGVVGELYIGGAGVARGYLGRPRLTAERFVADGLGGEPGARLYRTGDLGRWRPDGTIEFVGRNDFQVKVRGFRVEPGEIEARLREHDAVREAAVVAREEGPGDQRLVAYWVGEETAGAEALRRHVGERLPDYMVPAAYVRLERIPLTPNGKLDRGALPEPEGEGYARRGYEAPVGGVEQALAEVWSEVLGVERVGRRDDFFELGGHSLLVVRLIERMRRRGLHVEVRALFTSPTIAGLAEVVSGSSRRCDGLFNLVPDPGPIALGRSESSDVEEVYP